MERGVEVDPLAAGAHLDAAGDGVTQEQQVGSPGKFPGLDHLAIRERHLGAGREIQAGFDDAVVAEGDAEPGLGTKEAALPDPHALGPAAGEGPHRGRATPDVGAVTDHDAFAYLLRRYGITYVGAAIPSQSTRAQASAGALAALERTIRRERVKAVFPESSVNRSLAERIARDTGASAQYVLYGDTLGPADGPAGTYIGMEQTNTDALVRGMTGGRRGCRFTQ